VQLIAFSMQLIDQLSADGPAFTLDRPTATLHFVPKARQTPPCSPPPGGKVGRPFRCPEKLFFAEEPAGLYISEIVHEMKPRRSLSKIGAVIRE
jgi:hypothetical protein